MSRRGDPTKICGPFVDVISLLFYFFLSLSAALFFLPGLRSELGLGGECQRTEREMRATLRRVDGVGAAKLWGSECRGKTLLCGSLAGSASPEPDATRNGPKARDGRGAGEGDGGGDGVERVCTGKLGCGQRMVRARYAHGEAKEIGMW